VRFWPDQRRIAVSNLQQTVLLSTPRHWQSILMNLEQKNCVVFERRYKSVLSEALCQNFVGLAFNVFAPISVFGFADRSEGGQRGEATSAVDRGASRGRLH